MTYSTSATSSATTTATSATASTGGATAAVLGTGALSAATSALGVSLGSAGQLDGDFAVEDGLAVELSNGALGLGGGGQRNEGIADGALGAGVGGDGRGLAVRRVSCLLCFVCV